MIVEMVNRFISWKLPKDFNPDGGVSFRKIEGFEPVGTNLFTADQAKIMLEYVALPDIQVLEAERDRLRDIANILASALKEEELCSDLELTTASKKALKKYEALLSKDGES